MNTSYLSYDDACDILRAASISNRHDYEKHYQSLGNLPPDPIRYYADSWISWAMFLTGEAINTKYTMEEALAVVKAHNVTSKRAYRALSISMPRLPRNPGDFYPDWPGFRGLQGKVAVGELYSYEEAMRVVRSQGAKSLGDYVLLSEKDARLPSAPDIRFKGKWQGWYTFLGTIKKEFYTFEQAKKAAKGLNLKSSHQYMNLRGATQDPMLPSTPYDFYKEEWKGWSDFLGKGAR
jgi:hypothetical protein